MKRDGVEDEGERFVEKMLKQGLYRWTTFYAAKFDPSRRVSSYAHGRPIALIICFTTLWTFWKGSGIN
jgi:hypothetical protein